MPLDPKPLDALGGPFGSILDGVLWPVTVGV